MSTNCAVIAAVSFRDVCMTGTVGSYNAWNDMLTNVACMMKSLLPEQGAIQLQYRCTIQYRCACRKSKDVGLLVTACALSCHALHHRA